MDKTKMTKAALLALALGGLVCIKPTIASASGCYWDDGYENCNGDYSDDIDLTGNNTGTIPTFSSTVYGDDNGQYSVNGPVAIAGIPWVPAAPTVIAGVVQEATNIAAGSVSNGQTYYQAISGALSAVGAESQIDPNNSVLTSVAFGIQSALQQAGIWMSNISKVF